MKGPCQTLILYLDPPYEYEARAWLSVESHDFHERLSGWPNLNNFKILCRTMDFSM